MRKLVILFLLFSFLIPTNALALNPFDAENQALLEELEIELQPVDPIWQNPKFEEFLELMKDAKEFEKQEDFVSSILVILQAWHVADEINHSALALDPEERDLLERIEEVINDDPEYFAEHPEVLFGEILLWSLEIMAEEFEAAQQTVNVENVYGYASQDIADENDVIYLYISQPYLDGISVTWRQVYGTQVQWLPLGRTNEAAFRIPFGAKGDTLTFDYTVQRHNQVRKGRVSIDVYDDSVITFVPADDAITNLYHSLLGRNPDPEGYRYWKQQYDNGMPLHQIQDAFEASEEYKQLHR